ncbi:uncharacterized protein PV07_01921 [Cladophialophora immunda]|uniref:BZIP domain-containing protein n=1 Tax=Cladophialophora immunda TaxID=569365 RepID=A0A0D2BCD0_9EURO|nr:uncharacterized protein PV07_01921 [Cladophialophora immunda]KIW35212.1 hypothetical protein PV07_01921 [Cladophialophora immunda]
MLLGSVFTLLVHLPALANFKPTITLILSHAIPRLSGIYQFHGTASILEQSRTSTRSYHSQRPILKACTRTNSISNGSGPGSVALHITPVTRRTMVDNTSLHPATQFPSVGPRVESRIPANSDSGDPPGEMQASETAEMREVRLDLPTVTCVTHKKTHRSRCIISPPFQRRRAQNRLAQQAFRARQKIRVEALENEWAQLRHLHEALNQACSQQAQEIKQLQSRVDELLHNIELLKNSQEVERTWSSSPTTPEQQYPQTNAMTLAEAELRNFFTEGGGAEFPDFPESYRSHYTT